MCIIPRPRDVLHRPWTAGLPQQTMLEIRRRAFQGESGIGELLPLHYLMRVSYTLSPLGDHLSLAFADCLITLRGRHLGELRRDLANGKVGMIEEFDPGRWPQPASDAPVVLSVELIAPGQAAGRA